MDHICATSHGWANQLQRALQCGWFIDKCVHREEVPKKGKKLKYNLQPYRCKLFFPRRWEFVVLQFLTWLFAAGEIAQPVTSHNTAPLSVISFSTPQNLHCQENGPFTDQETPSKSKNFPRWKLKDVKGCFCYDSGQRRKYLWVFKGIFYRKVATGGKKRKPGFNKQERGSSAQSF